MKIEQALTKLAGQEDLSEPQMEQVMRAIMTGQCTDAQIGAFLIALRIKGETVAEICGAARVMRELATPVEVSLPHLVDTCGTGGSGKKLFNISTASAFVVAASGANVAKHSNRAVSSAFGGADLLEAAGVELRSTPEIIARTIESVGVGFMFAQAHHSAMRYAIGPRKQLGMRTLFNILGPLTNPAGVKRQVVGVAERKFCEPLAKALRVLGSEHVMVVHSADGFDEFSLAGPTYVAELRHDEIKSFSVSPADVGLSAQTLSGLEAKDAGSSLALIEAVFAGHHGDTVARARDIIALNAGASIYVAGVVASHAAGVEMAQDLIASRQAAEKFRQFIDFTQHARSVA